MSHNSLHYIETLTDEPCAVFEPLEKLEKLDDRAKVCSFAGYMYDGGGYRVWDPRKQVV
jgi:hypothetical protein